MKITEPVTMLTDFIIALEAGMFGILLIMNSESQLSRVYWGIALLITALGAVLGSISHGFKEYSGPLSEKIIWKSTTMSVGLSVVVIFFGTIQTLMPRGIWLLLITISAIATYVIYLAWMIKHDEFIYVIYYYVPFMVTVLILTLLNTQIPGNMYVSVGILITFIGFTVQVSGKGLHKHFNHNDIFHLIQLIAIYFFYLGASILVDR